MIRRTLLLWIFWICAATLAWSQEELSPLEFKFVCEKDKERCSAYTIFESGKTIYIPQKVAMGIDDIASVKVVPVSESSPYDLPVPLLRFQFTEDGRYKLEELSKVNVNKQMVIFVHGQFLSAPYIREAISNGLLDIPIASEEKARALAQETNQAKGSQTP